MTAHRKKMHAHLHSENSAVGYNNSASGGRRCSNLNTNSQNKIFFARIFNNTTDAS